MKDVLATINGQPLLRRDFEKAVQGYALEHFRKSMDHLTVEERQQAAELALEKLLARELIYQAALAEGIVADPERVEQEQEKIIANFPNPEAFAATIAKAGITPMEYYRMVRQDLTVNLMSERLRSGAPEPTPEEIETAWREQGPRLQRPGRLRASHLLVRGDEAETAAAETRCRELLAGATPENFAELARRHSVCPSAPGGGDLGWFRRGEMSPEFEEAAFSLPPGEIGGPLRTQFGWHLVLVTDRQEPEPLTREEALPRLRQMLRERVAADRLARRVAELMDAAEIRIEEPELPWPERLSKPAPSSKL